MLGKYGPFPKEGGACSSYLLRQGGVSCLVDCGNGCLSRLQRYVALARIDAILLSHLHFDHIADMTILRYALEIMRARGLDAGLPVPVYMPDAPAPQARLIADSPAFDVRPLSDGMRVGLGDMRVGFGAMTHPVPSYAMRFEAEGRVFVYSGDTNMNDNIVPFARDADLLLMEAGLLARDKQDNAAPHVSAREAGRIAGEARAKRMIATHIYPPYDEDEVLKELREEYETAEIAGEMRTYGV